MQQPNNLLNLAKETIKPANNPISGIKIVDYSTKSIAVIGDTKPIKEALKKIGGRFNPNLTCGAGWIFPLSARERLNQYIS